MKKLLALVLALVMTMSLVTISNAAFKDADKISNKEAVEVMAAVGVLAGYDNGNFGATDTLTRAQACKIVAYLDLGKDVADALVGTGKAFTDVPATNWAAGFIEYCAQAGYVAGIGDGKFAPNDQVTGIQFAKMLLGALGYKAEVQGYNGTDWSINIAKDAASNKLFEDVSGATSAALTREKAAQVALNALQATCVEYKGNGVTVKGDGFEVITNTAGATKVDTNGKDYKVDNEDDDHATMELCEKLYGDKLQLEDGGDEDDYGRAAEHTWKYDGFDSDNNDIVYTKHKTADYVFTSKMTNKEVYNKVGKTIAEDYTWKVNGTAIDSPEKTTATFDETANGTVTELFVNKDDEEVTVLYIPTYVGQITEWTAADEEDDTKESVVITGLTEGMEGDYDFETTAFTEKDADDETIVYFTLNADGDEVVTAAKAEKVTAKVTKATADTSFVAGETYKYSANYKAGDAVEYDKKFDVYLDSYGYAIYTVLSTGEESQTMAAVIEAIDKDETVLFDDDDAYKAKVVFTDGTKQVITLDADASVENLEDVENAEALEDLANVLAKLSYDEDDKVYTIEEIAAEADDEVPFKSGATNTLGTSITNSKTVFMVATYKDDGTTVDGYELYTGIKKLPSMNGTAQYLANDDNVVTVVYITESTLAEVDLASAIYVLYDDVKLVKDVNGSHYDLNAVVDGKVTTVMVSKSLYEDEMDGSVFVKSVTKNTKGVITSFGTDVENFVLNTTAGQLYDTGAIKAAKDEVITFDGTGYAYDEDAAVYQIEDGEITALKGISSISSTKASKTANFTLVLTKAGVITAVYYEVVDRA